MIRVVGVVFALALVVAVALPVMAGGGEPPRYFGYTSGYPDFGSAEYFREYYPADKWEVYGYGTGHLGMGYGPYIYGGYERNWSAEERPELSMPMLKPKVKWIGGNEVKVTAPKRPDAIEQVTVDILAFNGAVIATGTVTTPPFQIIAQLPEGATSIRVYMDLRDGFSSVVFPIQPVR
ncbi:MAG TPA: hypothetical protein PLU88_09345 [Armatimonadota bacterium]|jgi:hypothetical protein|nr:hypothetical protein [Armatimonadota bacterium]HOP79121.1 hypothetical protein [Armatimonadota bacterium]HPP75313.1 hypothetical protein [Armatimonadota bacterium]